MKRDIREGKINIAIAGFIILVIAALAVIVFVEGPKSEAEKTPQEIKVNVEQYDGFKGETFRLKAKAVGEITYFSSNRKVAKVKKNGRIKLLESGHAEIKIKAEGDGDYRAASRKISVNVYPEKLEAVKELKVENVSDTRAALTWEAADFATEYHLSKLNAASGQFEELMVVSDGQTAAEITRDAGSYAVTPRAVIGDKVIEGTACEAVTVSGTTDTAQTYSGSHTITKLDNSNLDLLRVINGDGSTKVPQSISLTNDCYVVSYVNHAGSAGKLVSYRKTDFECVDITSCSGMGHANGATYNPNTNRFYVVKTHQAIRTASCSTYDGTTKESAGTFNLPKVTSGIAYDKSNNKYYLSKGNEVYVCDSEFNLEKSIHKFVRYNHAQDIGAYNGVALVCTWVSGNTSYIDMYRVSDGAYLGSYDVSIGEIESCVVDDGYLVILMNTIGSSKDRLYRTKERIAVP